MATISIERIRKLRANSKVTYRRHVITVKECLIRLFKQRNEFIDMDEIMLSTGISYRTLHAMMGVWVKKGVIVRLYVNSRAFYGLPEFLKD